MKKQPDKDDALATLEYSRATPYVSVEDAEGADRPGMYRRENRTVARNKWIGEFTRDYPISMWGLFLAVVDEVIERVKGHRGLDSQLQQALARFEVARGRQPLGNLAFLKECKDFACGMETNPPDGCLEWCQYSLFEVVEIWKDWRRGQRLASRDGWARGQQKAAFLLEFAAIRLFRFGQERQRRALLPFDRDVTIGIRCRAGGKRGADILAHDTGVQKDLDIQKEERDEMDSEYWKLRKTKTRRAAAFEVAKKHGRSQQNTYRRYLRLDPK